MMDGYTYWVISVTLISITGLILIYRLAAMIIDRKLPKDWNKDQ